MIVKNKKPIARAMLVLLVSIAVPANTPQSERFGDRATPRSLALTLSRGLDCRS